MSEEHLVVDLEGTCCDDGSIPKDERETIEIGAVLVDGDGRPLREFSRIVRPTRHPVLTVFCRQLTGIGQADVDEAQPFQIVWPQFTAWVCEQRSFCSWGKYDLDQFRRDCAWHKKDLHFDHHCNLAEMFGKRVGNRKAMRRLGLEPTGTHHRGLDDARNIARVLAAMLAAGKVARYLPT